METQLIPEMKNSFLDWEPGPRGNRFSAPAPKGTIEILCPGPYDHPALFLLTYPHPSRTKWGKPRSSAGEEKRTLEEAVARAEDVALTLGWSELWALGRAV